MRCGSGGIAVLEFLATRNVKYSSPGKTTLRVNQRRDFLKSFPFRSETVVCGGVIVENFLMRLDIPNFYLNGGVTGNPLKYFPPKSKSGRFVTAINNIYPGRIIS